LLSALDFLPLAEQVGQLRSIDCWVLEEALTQTQFWKLRFSPQSPLIASVNIGSSLILDPNLIGTIQSVLHKINFSPQDLVLEIAESIISLNFDTLSETILRLKEEGIRLQIDDFGRGSSALLYLIRLPMDALKIERSLIDLISEDERNNEILSSIVSLAHKLGFMTVAEGIENHQQLKRLRELGCDFGQGHLLCNPLDQQGVETILAAFQTGDQNRIPWSKYW
jgi:EAL domain-containing protein (putative c-di-GMP-specific phosphodiesterase class I)